MTTLSVRLNGTADELAGFLRSLEYEPDLKVITTRRDNQDDESEDEPFGVGEIITLIVEFSIGLGSNAAYGLVASQFRRYRANRRHMKIRRLDINESSDELPTLPKEAATAGDAEVTDK